MRLFVAGFAMAVLLVGTTLRADDPPAPKGAVGVQLKVDEGKIVVFGTLPNSPAAKAGLKEGDVVVKVGDHPVKEKDASTDDLQELVKMVGKHAPGDKIKFAFKREGKDMNVEITVGKPGEIFPKKDE
ncbi:MAG TPA: PDZ domain-containing protein [Gemmataceae bacterium]|nr:PDZ domain-containing protein [Gemmataceae bacterium]